MAKSYRAIRVRRVRAHAGRPDREARRAAGAGEAPDPERGEGHVLVEVRAAPINPIDLAIGSGRFWGGSPDPPYVPGVEGMGEVAEGGRLAPGTRVYLATGEASNGSFAECVSVPEKDLIEVPEGIEDAVVACLGVAGLAAWCPSRTRRAYAEANASWCSAPREPWARSPSRPRRRWAPLAWWPPRATARP
jgi:D-arabinose 1-dehydrogenase-like Zn-dependent alcohol dehydrogenase